MSLTVILCTFNAKNKLDNMLTQLQQQIYQEFSVIIVDDGSTDNTEDLVQERMMSLTYKIQYFKLSHVGIGAARNYGLSRVKEEYFYFLDVDDFISPYLLSDNMKLIRTNNADIVDFGYTIQGENNIEIGVISNISVKSPQVFMSNSDFGKIF